MNLLTIYEDCFKFTDLNLVSSSGERVSCHKIILASRSEFVCNALKNGTKANNLTTEVITNHSTKDLKIFIEYLYTNKITKENETFGVIMMAKKYLDKKSSLEVGLKNIYKVGGLPLTDLNLISSNGDSISCHKVILGSRCKFFLNMFMNITENSTNDQIVFNNEETKDLQAFIEYVYTDQIAVENITISLLEFANKYLLDDFKFKCFNSAIAAINEQNVKNILSIIGLIDIKSSNETWKSIRMKNNDVINTLGILVNIIDMDNAELCLDVFDAFQLRSLLTGEESWKFASYLNLNVDNCVEKFLVGYYHDLEMLKVNALYYIQSYWNHIKIWKSIQKAKENYFEAMNVIELFISTYGKHEHVQIPYKVRLKRVGRSFGLNIFVNLECKHIFVTEVTKGSVADCHGGIKPRHCVLSINGKSLKSIMTEDPEDREHARHILRRMTTEMSESEFLYLELSVARHKFKYDFSVGPFKL